MHPNLLFTIIYVSIYLLIYLPTNLQIYIYILFGASRKAQSIPFKHLHNMCPTGPDCDTDTAVQTLRYKHCGTDTAVHTLWYRHCGTDIAVQTLRYTVVQTPRYRHMGPSSPAPPLHTRPSTASVQSPQAEGFSCRDCQNQGALWPARGQNPKHWPA